MGQIIYTNSAIAPFAVAIGAICIAFVLLRLNQSRRAARRVGELMQAAELLEYHARHLAQFLDSPMPPRRLKQILARVSSLLADREEIADFAAWVAAHHFDDDQPDAETVEVSALVAELGKQYPELERAYRSAVFCGLMGAMLRWPETASWFAKAMPAALDDASGNGTAAVRASHMVDRRRVAWASGREPAMAA